MTLSDKDIFPQLPYDKWKDTCDTLHRWTQIIGKIKLSLLPMQNHWWQVPLFVTASGLSTLRIPYGKKIFEMLFDFNEHTLKIFINDGNKAYIDLYPRSVADFYKEFMSVLSSLNIKVNIWTTPVEIDDRIPFEEDNKHASYDKEYAGRFWLTLVQVDRIMQEFRAKFLTKTSPVNFFWGSFDMAFSVYTGNPAPEYSGNVQNVSVNVMKEAMSMEEYACGFWPGAGLGEAAFYSYTYPEPAGIREYKVKPDTAYFSNELGEFLLPYDAVRTSPDPVRDVHDFLWSTYEAAAECGKWNRQLLEYKPLFSGANLK